MAADTLAELHVLLNVSGLRVKRTAACLRIASWQRDRCWDFADHAGSKCNYNQRAFKSFWRLSRGQRYRDETLCGSKPFVYNELNYNRAKFGLHWYLCGLFKQHEKLLHRLLGGLSPYERQLRTNLPGRDLIWPKIRELRGLFYTVLFVQISFGFMWNM